MRTVLSEEFEARIRAIIPLDLPESQPLYLLNQFDAGEGFGAPFYYSTIAYTSPRLCVQLEKRLTEIGIWSGDGPVIVCNAWGLAEMTDGAALSALIHEMAHVLDLFEAFQAIQDPTSRQRCLAAKTPDEAPSELWNFNQPLFCDHESRFIRAALHLKHRAERAGESIELQDLYVAGPRYGLSYPEHYYAKLREEIHDRENERLLDILSSPAPKEFRDLFADDVLAYYRRRFNDLARDAIAAGKSIGEIEVMIQAAFEGRPAEGSAIGTASDVINISLPDDPVIEETPSGNRD